MNISIIQENYRKGNGVIDSIGLKLHTKFIITWK